MAAGGGPRPRYSGSVPHQPGPTNFDGLSTSELAHACLAELLAGQDPSGVDEARQRALVERGREAFDLVALELRSPSARERIAALRLLVPFYAWTNGGFNDAWLAHLGELLRTESDDDVIAQIVHGLGTMSDRRTLPLMLPLSSHPSADVRWQVASSIPSAVVHEEDAEATAALIRLSRDPDDEVRNWATFGLGTQLEDVDNPALRAALLDRIDDQHDETRCEALVGLALRGDSRILPALHAALAPGSGEIYTLEVKAAGELADPSLHPLLVEIATWWEDEGDLHVVHRAVDRCDPELRPHYLGIEHDLLALAQRTFSPPPVGWARIDVHIEHAFPRTRLVATGTTAGGREVVQRWGVWSWMAEAQARTGDDSVAANLLHHLGPGDGP